MRAAVAEEEAQRREEAAQAKLRRAMELQLEIRAREEAAFREEENRAAQQKEFREEQARQEAEREKARLERLRLEKALEESRLAEEAAKSHHGEFKRLKLPVATSHVRALRFTDDGKSFYAATMGEGVFSWDVATWTQRRHQLELGKFVIGTPAIGAAAISPSGDKAFFGRHGGALRWYDLTRDPAPQSTMQIDERERQFAFNHIEVSPDGRHLITCHGNSVASLWDLPKRTRIKFLTDFKDQVHAAAFMGNTGTIAVGADFARIFSPKPYRKTDLRTENSSPLTSVAFSPDERHLSGIRGNTLYHWKIAEKKPIPFLASFSGKAMHMAYSPDGKNLAVAINPTRVYFYDPETLKQQWMLDMPKSGDLGNVPNAIAFHPDNRRFAVARESTIYVFDLSNLDKGK
jgi:hypothetical protein